MPTAPASSISHTDRSPNRRPILRVDGVSKRYHLYDSPGQRLLSYLLPSSRSRGRPFTALKEVDFGLQSGETLGIIGRNGSGKSTLLQIITGILTPSTGHVTCEGRVAALLELGAGFNLDFTGRENVRLNAAMYGLTRDEIDARMADIIAFSGIGDFIDQPVRQYSSGMFVRLAFSVIVHVDADVLIIDEALAVGDVMFSQKCMRFLEQFKQRGSILFVSHDNGAVSRLCDRVLWLEEGQPMGIGSPKEMLDRYLAHVYGEQQPVRSLSPAIGQDLPEEAEAGEQTRENEEEVASEPMYEPLQDVEPWYDAREYMQGSPALYNAIEVHRFDENSGGFGDGGATITDICFRDTERRRLSGILGGMPVNLELSFVAHRDLERLIVGFLIKDRLGQVILGDNNCIIHQDNPVNAEAGKTYQVSFGLTMPYLAVSEYIVSAAVASGTQAEHIQHCWLHDGLVFRAEKGPVVHGIMGIPMAYCDIREQEQA